MAPRSPGGAGAPRDGADARPDEARRRQRVRDEATYVIWAPSPPASPRREAGEARRTHRPRRRAASPVRHRSERRSRRTPNPPQRTGPRDGAARLPSPPRTSPDAEIGPQPAPPSPTARDYGRGLRPGEGAAMAAYVRRGQRVPRRGEIGLDASQIEAYERAGYVMSGSRHERMSAVRARKEGQVASAHERHQRLAERAERRAQHESAIIGQVRAGGLTQFRDMVEHLQRSP